jgi:hypothetical protein
MAMTDDEHNQLLTNGSNTPQHDLLLRNAPHLHHHHLTIRNSREKDLNSNLLHAETLSECGRRKRSDGLFDNDSLSAAFSTPLMQRRCSELAAVTFHHFRHSPQPPTPAPTANLMSNPAFATYPLKTNPPLPVPILCTSTDLDSSHEPPSPDTQAHASTEPEYSRDQPRLHGNCGPSTTHNMLSLPSNFSHVPFICSDLSALTTSDTSTLTSTPQVSPSRDSISPSWTQLTRQQSVPSTTANLFVTQHPTSGQIVTSLSKQS